MLFRSLVPDNALPFSDKSFDLVFSSFVLFEMSSLKKIEEYLIQARRVLKEDGYFIAIIASIHMYDPKFKSRLISADFPENKNRKSGSQVKMHYNEINMTFIDYFWFEEDYRKAFTTAGLQVCAIAYPLGKSGEHYPWEDELKKSPILLFLAAKKCR